MAADVLEIAAPDQAAFRAHIIAAAQPVVMRGLAAAWPAVAAGGSIARFADYLRSFDTGGGSEMLVGSPAIGGRFFYDAQASGFNFDRVTAPLGGILDRLQAAAAEPNPPAIAAQAVPAASLLPGFSDANPMPLVPDTIAPRLWIGNRVRTATHQDMMSNIAVVVAGRRRFTLFPPDQVANLYLGPLEFTPNGTPVSLVDEEDPDLAAFPRFAHAMAAAQTAELAPGDAIYIPYMWWHAVRSLDSLSVLANYWWNEAPPPQPGLAPIDVLVHALLAFADLPAEQLAAWQPMFETLVFQSRSTDLARFPHPKQGIRGPLDPAAKQRLRRQLAQLLGR